MKTERSGSELRATIYYGEKRMSALRLVFTLYFSPGLQLSLREQVLVAQTASEPE